MSGRGRGHFRGRGRFNRSSAARNTVKKKTKVEDHVYYLGYATQASDYEITTSFIINHILKTFKRGLDVGTALENLNDMDTTKWAPKLKTSTEADADKKKTEEKQYEMEFKDDYSEYKQRLQTYDDNKVKAYALLWERCSKGMKNKVESRTDFATINKDPIKLLKAIKEHALNYQENRYEMAIISSAMRCLLNCKQKEKESLQDYTKRYRVAEEVLVSHLGCPIFLRKLMETMPNYDSTQPDMVERCGKEKHEQLMAYMYLENADQSKYGSILVGLNTQKSLKNDQYPKTITEANNVLSNHEFDKKSSGQSNKSSDGNNNSQKGNKEKSDKDNKDDEPIVLSFAQMEGRCYCCGKSGHKSTSCRYKDRPKNEWAINKTRASENNQQHAQVPTGGDDASRATEQTNPQSSDQNNSESYTGWMHAQIGMNQLQKRSNLRDLILLDTCSSKTVFCNRDMVTNIRDADDALILNTNGGDFRTTQEADLAQWGTVWFNEKSAANIFSFGEMAKKYRIIYDNANEDAFRVISPKKEIKFYRVSENIYAFDPKNKNTKPHIEVSFLETLEENKMFYTERQLKRARVARRMMHAIGHPSLDDYKAAITWNGIRDCPVTHNDLVIAGKIFGKEIAKLKSMTTRRRPAPVVDDTIEIPPELRLAQQYVTLCADGMHVNTLIFLTTIALNIYYRSAQHINATSTTEFLGAFEDLLAIYYRSGFKVTEIRADEAFRPLMTPMALKHRITMNLSNPQEHVPEAERNNRTIQERVRACYHYLPYYHLCKTLVKMIVMESAKKLNFFPARHGVSKYYSPRMIIHRKQLDYNKHCKYAIGEYVQAHDEPSPSNTNAPRTLDCIYLRYNDNHQGGHQLLHLQTNKIITRRKVTEAVITPQVVKQVHAIAESEGMPKGLKITNKQKVTLFDSALIAGVDYDENFDEEDYEDEQSQNDNSDNDEEDDNSRHDEMDPDEVEGLEYDARNNAARNEETRDNESNQNQNQDNEENVAAANNDDEENNVVSEAESEAEEQPRIRMTRSGRVVKEINRTNLYQMFIASVEEDHKEEYTIENARVLASMMCILNDKLLHSESSSRNYQFIQRYTLMRGLKKFKEKGKASIYKEMQQIIDRVVFQPIHLEELTEEEIETAMESLIFLTEKRDLTVKARMCANGSTQRAYLNRDDVTSPTVITESVTITATIDAKQGRDVMTCDVPNAFVQTEIEKEDIGKRIIMKIRGPLVDILVELAPEIYEDYVINENGRKTLYVLMLKALYGMMVSSLLYYKKFRKDMESIGFIINPYDPCVANRIVRKKQQTVTWHVDDLKSSHVDPEVNTEYLKWLEMKYAEDGIGKVKTIRGDTHDYLGMNLHFGKKGVVQIEMIDYIKKMCNEFPEKLDTKSKYPWSDKLFKVDDKSKKLDTEKGSMFHTMTMKGMYLCKRARPDIQPAITFYSTRVKDPTEQDWTKLKKTLGFLLATINDVLTLEADDTQTITWYIDAAFAVHVDMKSHTGGTMTLGKGSPDSSSLKQKVNSRSSTESELISIDDLVSKVLWTRRFIEAQGFVVKFNVVFRDNTSAMKLEENGRMSTGKRTRHFDIKYFYVTDLIKRGDIIIEYCPTENMRADYLSKPLVGPQFHKHRKEIMNLE